MRFLRGTDRKEPPAVGLTEIPGSAPPVLDAFPFLYNLRHMRIPPMSRTQPFPVKCFLVVLAAAVALYLVLGGLLLAVNRQAREFRERIDKLDGAVHDLQLDSETMANLALLAATTGESDFATRHAAFRERQLEALDLLRGVGSGSLRPEDLTHLEMLLNAIWATEQSALTQMTRGAQAKALPLLRTAAYMADRDTLRADLARLYTAIEAWADSTLAEQSRYTNLAIWSIVFFTPLLILVAFTLLRLIKRSIRASITAQTALAESARTVEALLNATTDRVILVDGEGRVLAINSAGAQGIGLPPEQILGKTLFDLFPKHVATGRLDIAHQAMASGQSQRYTDERDGVVYDHIVTPLAGAADRPRGAALFARDITDIVRAREAAETANRAKSEFLANVGHEIRTPLNAILGMTQVLSATELSADQRPCLDDIRTASEGLLTLVSRILELTHLDAGTDAPEQTPFVLGSILQAVFATQENRARDKGLALHLCPSAEVPPLLVGDGDRLRRTLEHLLANAVKFTPAGDVSLLTQGVKTDPVAPGTVALRFAVRDTGIGIAPGDQERIFERFAQADGSATRRFGGTGLGLTIASRLVASLGGTISLQSVPGQGSEFAFVLRFALPEDDEGQ